MLSNVLNTLLHLHSKPFTLTRPDTDQTGLVRAAPSNYYRNLQGPAEVVISGREFVISTAILKSAGFEVIKRGDRLFSEDLGSMSIVEAREIYDFGGAIMGYRIRTS